MATEVTKAVDKEVEAPKLLWAQIYDSVLGPVAATYTSDPREVHDNGKPVYQYMLIDASNTRQRAERAASRIVKEAVTIVSATTTVFDGSIVADIIAAEFER